jgi:hypothetical protein
LPESLLDIVDPEGADEFDKDFPIQRFSEKARRTTLPLEVSDLPDGFPVMRITGTSQSAPFKCSSSPNPAFG